MSQALESIITQPAPLISQNPTERGLTLKQKKFVKYYIQTGNAYEAAKLAGYTGEPNTLRSTACDNMTKPAIIAAINRLLDPIADAEEVLTRLTKYSRADITDVLGDSGSFDVRTAKENGTSDLIKSVKYDKEGNLTGLEIHDAHEATRDLARIHGLFIDRTQSESINLHIHASVDERAGKLAELIAKASQRQIGQGESTKEALHNPHDNPPDNP